MKRYFKKYIIQLAALCSPMMAFAAEQATAAPKESSPMDVNTYLLIIFGLLLLPILFSGKTFLLTVKSVLDKNKSAKTLSIIAFVLLSSSSLWAQDAAAPVPQKDNTAFLLTYSLLAGILFEIIALIVFAINTNNLLMKKSESLQGESNEPSVFSAIWEKMNSFNPIEEEAKLDTGHDYDGIRELNNITPPWFSTAFILSILFAIVYMYRYHVAESAPLPHEEFQIEMAQAEEAQRAFLATQSNKVDENNVTLLGASEIEAGKSTFKTNCAVCHGENGGSQPGGVGPNLTDDHWLYGGSIKDIFTTIKYGRPNGMKAWKDELSPKQIAELTSYVKSIKGTVTAGGKEPQGNVYEESATAAKSDSTSITASNDTTIKK